MRKCIRCQAKMAEGLEIKTNDALGLAISEKGLFKGSLGKTVAAVCPECGYVELYLEHPEKVKSNMK